MFSRKYVFETSRTKFIRLLKNLALAFVVFLVTVIFIGFYLPLFSKSESENSEQFFYKKDPDLIAVYTGDAGRINFALKLSEKYKTSKVLISGVYSSNSIKSLLAKQASDRALGLINEDRIEIDHVAKNTFENVLSTFHYLRKTQSYKKILIISNDYHIIRIKLIVDSLQNPQEKFEIYYRGIDTDYTQWRNIKVLYKEVIKYMKAFAFLMLWDQESIGQITLENNNDY